MHLTDRSAYRFQRSYIRSHLADVAQNVKKPFILEECVLSAAREFVHRLTYIPPSISAASICRFGKITEDKAQSVRNQYYVSAYSVAEENAKAHGPLQGTLFW